MSAGFTRLGDLAIAHYGKALKEADRSDGGSYAVFGSSGHVGRHDKALVEHPTIVIGRKGSVGAVAFAPEGGWPIDTTYYLELNHPDRVDLRYLYWALTRAGLGRRAITTSIPGLNRDELYRTMVFLPLLAEQRRIAAVLDRADGIRGRREESLQLLNGFLRSAFLEMFGDPVRNEKGWKVDEFGSVIRSIEPGVSVKGEDGAPGPTEWAVLKISAVTSGRYVPEDCKVVRGAPERLVVPARGDLLFSRANTRELVAATCIVDRAAPRVFLPDKLWKITSRAEVVTNEYLRYLLAEPRFRATLTRHATGTSGSMLNVSQEKLLRLRLPIPPIHLQQRFANQVWRTYDTRARLNEAGNQADKLFDSLAQRAFRGEL